MMVIKQRMGYGFATGENFLLIMMTKHRTMKLIFLTLAVLLLTSCVNRRSQNHIAIAATDTTQLVYNPASYPEDQLEAFLDSIGHLSPALWTERIAFATDSVYQHVSLRFEKVPSGYIKT